MRRGIPKTDLTEDDLKAIDEAKQDIKKRYNELFSRKPGDRRKYGDVSRIMNNARNELNRYVSIIRRDCIGCQLNLLRQVNIMHKQGVAIGGWGVSLDNDPVTNFANFTFAGGPSGQGYFAMKKANLKLLMSEYQLYGK
jgi:hypothetical protein